MRKYIIISAPSGAGKSTIINSLPLKELRLSFSISACNRAPRKGEKDKEDYYFLSTKEFLKRINNDEFIEWEEVYHQHYYGTLKSEINRIFESKHFPIFDIDVAGGLRLKEFYKENALAIFIMPPSVEELEKRLSLRNTDSPENVKKRIDKASQEIDLAPQFDTIILNDDLEKAIRETQEKIQTFLAKD